MVVKKKNLSVIMGIYNCETTLVAAVQSIQEQSYTNWELIICDDGSSDNTYKIAEKLALQDDRIILIRNKNNRGLSFALNRCLNISSGKYIARMDGDDLCVPDRFEKQVELLDSCPNIAIVSSWMTLFDDDGDWGVLKVPEYPSPAEVVTGNPIPHAPSMMRREAIKKVHGYTVDKRVIRVEDVDLWIRLYAEGYRCHNILEPLYKMRNDQNALYRRKYKYRVYSTRVRLFGCKILHLSVADYFKAFRPMVNGQFPARIRLFLRSKL